MAGMLHARVLYCAGVKECSHTTLCAVRSLPRGSASVFLLGRLLSAVPSARYAVRRSAAQLNHAGSLLRVCRHYDRQLPTSSMNQWSGAIRSKGCPPSTRLHQLNLCSRSELQQHTHLSLAPSSQFSTSEHPFISPSTHSLRNWCSRAPYLRFPEQALPQSSTTPHSALFATISAQLPPSALFIFHF